MRWKKPQLDMLAGSFSITSVYWGSCYWKRLKLFIQVINIDYLFKSLFKTTLL